MVFFKVYTPEHLIQRQLLELDDRLVVENHRTIILHLLFDRVASDIREERADTRVSAHDFAGTSTRDATKIQDVVGKAEIFGSRIKVEAEKNRKSFKATLLDDRRLESNIEYDSIVIDKVAKHIAQMADFPLALFVRNQASDDRVVHNHVRPLKALVEKRFIRRSPVLIHVQNRNLECIAASFGIRNKARLIKERSEQARICADPGDDRIPPENTSASVVHDLRKQRRHVEDSVADDFVLDQMTERKQKIDDILELHFHCDTKALDNLFVFFLDKSIEHRVVDKVVLGKHTVPADGVFKVALDILGSDFVRADTEGSPAVKNLLVRDADGLIKMRLVRRKMVIVGLLVEKGLARHEKVVGRVVHADDGGLHHGSHDRHGHGGLACKERVVVAGLDELNSLIFCEAGHFAAWGAVYDRRRVEFVSYPPAPAAASGVCLGAHDPAPSQTLPLQKQNVEVTRLTIRGTRVVKDAQCAKNSSGRPTGIKAFAADMNQTRFWHSEVDFGG